MDEGLPLFTGRRGESSSRLCLVLRLEEVLEVLVQQVLLEVKEVQVHLGQQVQLYQAVVHQVQDNLIQLCLPVDKRKKVLKPNHSPGLRTHR